MNHEYCIACKKDRLKVLKKYSQAHLVQCNSCGLVFSQKIPSNQELKDYYKVYAYNDNVYSDITKQRYLELLQTFEKYRKTNKILDVGCGNGFFLEIAKKQGWEVYGTEFSEKAIEILNKKGINSKTGSLKVNNYAEGMFDIITSFEVLEHIYNPIEELNKFNYLLRNNGLLYATTPNFNSLSRKLLNEKWNIITYPEHLTYYSCKSINKILVNSSFLKLHVKTTGFSISRLQISINQKSKKNIAKDNDLQKKSKDELIRYKMNKKGLFNLIIKAINYFLNIFKLGDTIKIYYIKHNFNYNEKNFNNRR